jgi:hypothetical protein
MAHLWRDMQNYMNPDIQLKGPLSYPYNDRIQRLAKQRDIQNERMTGLSRELQPNIDLGFNQKEVAPPSAYDDAYAHYNRVAGFLPKPIKQFAAGVKASSDPYRGRAPIVDQNDFQLWSNLLDIGADPFVKGIWKY